MSAVAAIAELAIARYDHDGEWWVTTDDLESIVNPVDLYRVAYDARMTDIHLFTSANAGELVTLLERLGQQTGRNELCDAETALRKSGLFLTHEDRIELMRRLVRAIKVRSASAPTDPDAFRTMLRDCRSFDRAVETYIAVFLDLDSVVQSCAREFTEDRPPRAGAEAVASAAAEAQLRQLLQRRIVVVAELLPALFELLRTIARQEGYLRDFTADEQSVPVADGRKEALRILGLGERHTTAELRQSYRRLMRRYHPDINPDGLEMAKRINAAYAVLTGDARR